MSKRLIDLTLQVIYGTTNKYKVNGQKYIFQKSHNVPVVPKYVRNNPAVYRRKILLFAVTYLI